MERGEPILCPLLVRRNLSQKQVPPPQAFQLALKRINGAVATDASQAQSKSSDLGRNGRKSSRWTGIWGWILT